MIRASLHMHSTWSDGEFSIADLRDLFVAEGCRVICVTDHADAFDEQRVAAYVAECAALSDARALVLPSLEFGCADRTHILGFGVTALTEATGPDAVIAHISDAGGVSVIAHPRTEAFERIASMRTIPDGIEAWNTKYDGKRAPRPETFALIRQLRERRPDLHAFFGIDLHWRRQFRGLHVMLDLPDDGTAPTREAVLGALARGAFRGVTSGVELASSGDVPADTLARFAMLQRRSRTLRSVLRGARRLADVVGIRPPAGLKARLRGWL